MYKNLKDELRQFYETNTKSEDLLSKINNLKRIQYTLTENRTELHGRFIRVVKQLNSIYQHYKFKLESELEYFRAEERRLRNLRRIQENTTRLLSETYSATFIPRCKRLFVQKANYLSKQGAKVRKKLKFEVPSNTDFQSICEDFILGYFTYEYIDKNYLPLEHSFLVRGHPRSSSLSSRISRSVSLKAVRRGLEPSPTLHRQRSLSRSRLPEGSPVLMRSQSLVELPTFTVKPEEGAAEQLSRTPSKTSLKTIAEDILDEKLDVTDTGREFNEVFG